MRIEHFALQVPDPVAMADWYVKNLGFSIARSGPPPISVRFLKTSSGAVMLEIYRNPKATVPDHGSMDPLHLHIAFLSNDLAAERDRLVKAGAKVAEDIIATPAGDQLLMLRDPWGLALQFLKRAEPML
jgi:glyoxylase I family protein